MIRLLVSTLIIIVLGLIIIFIALDFHEIYQVIQKKKREEEKWIEEQRRKDREEYQNKIELSFNNEVNKLIQEYGDISNDLLIDDSEVFDVKNHILIFEKSSHIVINKEPIPYKSILGYSLVDNSTVVGSLNLESSSKSSTKSMLGRAIAGGLVAGPVGAIIGGSTAKVDSTSEGEMTQSVSHDYTLYINIDNLSCPNLEMHLGEDTSLAYNIASILNIIVNRNKQL